MNRLEDSNNNSIYDRATKVATTWRRLRLPSYFAIAVLLLLVLIIPVTRSWFVRNLENKSVGKDVKSAEVAAGAMPYTLYIARPSANDMTVIGEVIVVTKDDNESNAVLNPFDAIFGGNHNKYTSAYIRVPVYGIPEGKNMKLTITCQSDYLDAQNRIEKYISNIIQVSCASIPVSVIAENASSLNVYNGALTYFQNNAANIQTKTFVNYTITTNANGIKDISNPQKNLEGTEKGISFIIASNQIQSANEKAYIYFKIDYNEDLVYHFIRNALWGTGGFKLDETAADSFAGTISNGNSIVYDLKDITVTFVDP